MTSGGQVPIARLQVKRVTQSLSAASTMPPVHAAAPIGVRQRRAVPPPSVSSKTTYSQSSPSIAQTRACRLPRAENDPPATALHARIPSHRHASLDDQPQDVQPVSSVRA